MQLRHSGRLASAAASRAKISPMASIDLKISRAFATPIALHRPARSPTMDADLAAQILATAARSASTARSNIGGWRSAPDLLDWPGAAVAELGTILRQAIEAMIKVTAGPSGFDGYFKVSAWANLLHAGNYNTLHAHPESAWSGVYYVDAGERAAADELSGLLELRDPRPAVEMVPAPGWPFGNPLRIQPETGLMVLFPSWLYHQVHPYRGQRPRIAVAFNAPVHQGALRAGS
jgi:uncharacterized protein (TIGR02466 family)